jgi:hypothetical protein|tara:strand:+ start:1017 stop:1469 length:453 start_codon:yes stop_codon:yes gene_type:complete
MTTKPDITYRLTTREPFYTLTNDDLVEAANEIVDLRAKVQLLELQYSVLLAKNDENDELDRDWHYPFTDDVDAEQREQDNLEDEILLRQGKMFFCDDCGRKIRSTESFIYGNLPCDIDSANAGESAVVCHACNEKIEANANNEHFKRNYK